MGGYVINSSHSLMPAAYVQYSYLGLFWDAANLLICLVQSMTRGHFTVKCAYFLILIELCCVWFMQVQGLHVWSHISALHKLPSVQEAHQHRQGNSTPAKLNNPFEARVHLKIKMYSSSGKFSITILAHQWILFSEWVPSE